MRAYSVPSEANLDLPVLEHAQHSAASEIVGAHLGRTDSKEHRGVIPEHRLLDPATVAHQAVDALGGWSLFVEQQRRGSLALQDARHDLVLLAPVRRDDEPASSHDLWDPDTVFSAARCDFREPMNAEPL